MYTGNYDMYFQYVNSMSRKYKKLLRKQELIKAYIGLLEEMFPDHERTYNYYTPVISEQYRKLDKIAHKLRKIKRVLDLNQTVAKEGNKHR